MKECSNCRHCYEDDHNFCPIENSPLISSIPCRATISGRYILEKRLGKGGMGIVFKAKHKFLKSSHAVKVILPHLVEDDKSLLIRFKQEAILAASIDHPNVIRVTDFGVEDEIMPYLVMEYIDGIALSSFLVRDTQVPVETAFDLFQPIASGVAEAHRKGIVHRDLKPQNIMVQKNLPLKKGVKVLDFGLAKIKSSEFAGSLIQAQTINMLGSPAYMSPEQWEGEKVDHHTDIYSLGVILFEILTGRLPFRADTVPSLMYQHLTAQPPSFTSLNISVSPRIEAIVQKSLRKKAEERFAAADEMIEEFEQALLNYNSADVTIAINKKKITAFGKNSGGENLSQSAEGSADSLTDS